MSEYSDMCGQEDTLALIRCSDVVGFTFFIES
jgi:hypothetical protein